MSAIKKFFEKKKLEIKFKKAGEGKKLTEEQVSKSPQKSKQEFFGSTQFTEEKKKAAEAAINRLTLKNETKGYTQANEPKQNTVLTPPQLTSNSVSNLKVNFSCPLFENESFPKNELETKINEYLYSQLPTEPEMVSLLIVHTLNKNSDQIKECIEMLDKYLSNIISHPTEEKYRRIKITNRILSEKILPLQGAEAFLQSTGFVRKVIELDGASEEYIYCEESDVDKLVRAKELLSIAEPIPMSLDRDLKIYLPSTQALLMPQLSEDFFSITAEELKKEQEIRKKAVEESGMLMTKEMREKDRRREMRRFKYVLIRCRLPDQFIIQATFTARETIDTVRNFVLSCAEDESLEFHFFSQVCGRISESDEGKALVELGLAPAALLEVVDDRKGGGSVFLKKDLANLAIKL